MSKPQRLPSVPEPGRLVVSTVYVDPAQVWFPCPGCGTGLEGYLSDPRGIRDMTCEECGTTFDVPARAAIVIT